ncbi:MAG: hypothetical protein LBK58_13215 [Prevotellaceae bacterium]|jgi:hypothetical protein|nr:hypothetical protein [Prevotellaceae bacterium]
MEIKKCPYCGKTVLAISKACKHCKKSFEVNHPETVRGATIQMPSADIDVPDTRELEPDRRKTEGEQDFELLSSNTANYLFEHERQEKKESHSEQEMLSIKNIILIIIVNIILPVIGGIICYLALSRSKAKQSIVVSAIVSIIRIAYLVENS